MEHVNIPEGQLHETKGISLASEGDVLVADGAGSGSWQQAVVLGWEDYHNDLGAQALTSGLKTDLLNDGNGANTNTTYKLPGTTGIWDTINNQFDWEAGGLEVGDTVDIRFDLTATVNTANDNLLLELDMAHGHANEFSIPVEDVNIDLAGSKRVTLFTSLYMGSDYVLTNPAKVSVTANSAGDSVLVHGWYVRVLPRKPRYA